MSSFKDYLGALAKEQNCPTPPRGHKEECLASKAYPIRVRNRQGDPVMATMFWFSNTAVDNLATTIKSERQEYAIANYSDDGDRSVHVLSLLTQFMALQNEGTESPSPSNVRVVR